MVEFTPDHFDRLHQVRIIAEHADSALWLMRHADGQQFAVKLLNTPIFAWRVRSLFVQRLNLVLRIHHPHLLPVYAGRVRRTNQCVAVAEYLARGSLYDAVAAGERRMWALPLAPAEAARLVGEIAAGVQALHDHALLHGGLKLTNVLLDVGSDGTYHARVTDMLLHDGVAGLPQTGGKESAGLRDPLLYLAPEQFQRRPALASDQYALGVIAFLLLTGEAPYDRAPIATVQAHVPVKPLHASALNPILPQMVDEVLARAMRRAPKDRYPSMQAFAEALQQTVMPRALARVLRLPAGSIPVARTAGLEPITQPHDAVQPLPPLAVLRLDQAPVPPGMPDLPPQYAWSVEAVARQALPQATSPNKRSAQRHAARRASTALLWVALVVVLALIMALTLLLTMSAMHH